MKKPTSNKTRRTVLKTAGVAGVAAGVWHKPVMDAVMTPAHAQTSMMLTITLGGSSSSTLITRTNKSGFDNLVNNAVEALIPSAQAVTAGPVSNLCNLFLLAQDDYRHCIELAFPGGNDVNGVVNVSLNGPDIYYGFICQAGYYYYYSGVTNLSNAGSATMTEGAFSVTLGSAGDDAVEISGQINPAFDAASGTMIYKGAPFDISQQTGGSYYCDGSGSGNGAYWNADLAGGSSCSISGLSNTDMIVVGPGGSCVV